MYLWKNTKTLDAFIPELSATVPPEDAQLAVIGSKPINLSSMPRLQAIFKCGVGTDNVPFQEAADRGIRIGLPSENTRNIIFEETANFATAFVFRMLYSKVGDLEDWTKAQRPFLKNRKVLLLGQGNIGKLVKRKLEPSVEVLTFDAATDPPGDLEPLVRQAEVVSLHIPLSDATRGFWNAEKLAWMPDQAALVNTARGPIVDERALLAEIESGRLRAAFDVFWEEPYHGPLRAFHPDRFFMTPHVASTCKDFLSGLAADFLEFQSQLETNSPA